MNNAKQHNRSHSSPYTLAAGAVILFFVAGFAGYIFLWKSPLYNQTQNKNTVSTQKQSTSTGEVVTDVYDSSFFSDVHTIAKSFVVYDPLASKVVASKDENTAYPLASVTKVMTAYVAYKNIDKNETITIQKSDLMPDGDSGLRIGDIWKRDDLIAYTLSVSSNDGARALARTGGIRLTGTATDTNTQVAAFIDEMNKTAESLGLSSMHFNNESGLDLSASVNGGYGNALDVAKLFAKVYVSAPAIFENTTKSISTIGSSDGNNTAKNTNEGASHIPGLVASKTGFTDLALGNLGVVVEMGPANPVVIVVLHSTKEGRFTDVEKLRKITLQSMK